MGIVPVGLKEKMDRYLRNNAERTDAHLGDVTSDSLSTEDTHIAQRLNGMTAADLANPLYPFNTSPVKIDKYHKGLHNGILPHPDSSEWTIYYRAGSQHAIDGTSVVKAFRTHDRGGHVAANTEQTIYDETGVDARNGVHGVMNGRFGIIMSRDNDDGSGASPVFVYSDDNGTSWNSTILSSVSYFSGFGRIVEYPASVGGDDDNGFICFGVDNDKDAIKYLYTTDNGDSWTVGEAVSNISYRPSEPNVARLGDTDRWVMIWRNNDDSLSNARIGTSTDLTNFTDEDSGVPMGGNPPTLFSHGGFQDGYLTWMVPDRDGDIFGQQDFYLHQSSRQSDIWDDPTAWDGWERATRGGADRSSGSLVGYMMEVVEEDGQYYGLFADNEGGYIPAHGSGSQLYVMSSESVTTAQQKLYSKVGLESDQSIASTTDYEKIQFDTVDASGGFYDYLGSWWADDHRMDAAGRGTYRAKASIEIKNASDGDRFLFAIRDGNDSVLEKDTKEVGQSGYLRLSASWEGELTPSNSVHAAVRAVDNTATVRGIREASYLHFSLEDRIA